MEDLGEEMLVSCLRRLGIGIEPRISTIRDLVDPPALISICSQSLYLLLDGDGDGDGDGSTSFPTSLPDPMPERVQLCTDIATAIHSLGYSSEISFHKFLYPSEEDSYNLVGFLVERLSEARKTARLVDKVGPKTLKGDFQSISGDLEKMALQIEEDILKPEQEPTPCEEFAPQFCKREDTCDQEKAFVEDASGNDLELQHLNEELELLQEAMRMALDNEHSVIFYIEQLNEQIKARRHDLKELEDQWDVHRKPLEERRWDLLESFCATNPDSRCKLQKLKEIEKESHSVLSEIRKREDECAKLAGDLAKQPKVDSRRTFIQRITEITNNSRKLDADIERILKDTRELKLESNSIEERLHRTYGVVDETVFRESKKDSVGRQAHRLLTSIHESFEEIREKILATDKARREVAELEARLSVIGTQSLDMDKIQADLEAMRMENELLEKALQNH